MGKSLKNVVTPDEMYDLYGADTFRLYEMSMGPMDSSRPWASRDVVGMLRFLQRLWRNIVDEETGELVLDDGPADAATRRKLHQTIAAVRDDYPQLRFNTAIAKLIELNNHLTKNTGPVSREVAEAVTLMIAPVCPHIAEELWNKLGHATSLAYAPFPVPDESELVAETVELPVQINGKVRSRIQVAADASAEAIEAAALADEKVAQMVGSTTPKKVVVVPAKMVSIVL
jgi:leucyl-tRNA synthetase